MKNSIAPSRAVDALMASVRGQDLRAEDPAFDDVRKIHDGMIDREPAIIVRCAGAADVVRCIRVARENGMVVSIRGGGHSVAGFAVCDGGLMIDLSAAAPYDAGIGLSAYVRGLAWLRSRRGIEAAAEFQTVVERGLGPVALLLRPLAQVGLARAFALQGDVPKARVAYQDFLPLWKNADPDIPILMEAKAEYTKLQ